MKACIHHLLTFIALISVQQSLGVESTFPGDTGWILSDSEFYSLPVVNGKKRFSTFNAQGANDTGYALFQFSVDATKTQLSFAVSGGDASVLLIKDNHSLSPNDTASKEVVLSEILEESYGPILYTKSGPRDVDGNQAVNWDLSPYIGEALILAIVDSLQEPWGFVGVTAFTWGQPQASSPSLFSRSSTQYDAFELNVGNHYMPGSLAWGIKGDTSFDRRLYRNTTPFITTYTKTKRNGATGATWTEITVHSKSDALKFKIKGGNAEVLLLDGAFDLANANDITDISEKLQNQLSDRIIYRAQGNHDTQNFQDITWELHPAWAPQVTFIVLDDKTDDLGFIDVSLIHYIQR